MRRAITHTRGRLPADRFGTDRRPTYTVSPSEYYYIVMDNIELLPIGQGPHQTADNDNNISLCNSPRRTR